jgi:hypothetical protein
MEVLSEMTKVDGLYIGFQNRRVCDFTTNHLIDLVVTVFSNFDCLETLL